MSEKVKREPYWWVSPNPSGVSRELMTPAELKSWIDSLHTFAVPGEGFEATLALLTEDELAAMAPKCEG